MQALPKKYKFKEIEQKWQQIWEEKGIFHFDWKDTKTPTYSIDTPPPYPSGDFHMGNILNWTYFDMLARYKRMQGYNVLFPQGWDCHGLSIEVQVEKMRLISPIDGRIEKINVETGESINALTDVVRVVKIDPLWIDVPVPLDIATDLSILKKAIVIFPSPNRASVEGNIIFISAVADAASGTLRVRIEVPNKSNRPAGEHVEVVFPSSRK